MKLDMSKVWMHAIFCDDVREELGEKQSYMGVYGESMTVPMFPAKLHKLHVMVFIYFVEWDAPNYIHLTLRQESSSLEGGKVLFSESLDPQVLENALASGDGFPFECIKINLTIQDIEFCEESSLSVFAEAGVAGNEDGEGSWYIIIENNRVSVKANQIP